MVINVLNPEPNGQQQKTQKIKGQTTKDKKQDIRKQTQARQRFYLDDDDDDDDKLLVLRYHNLRHHFARMVLTSTRHGRRNATAQRIYAHSTCLTS